MAAIQLMWACGTTACAFKVWTQSTHFPTSEGWPTELTAGLWFVVPAMGFQPNRLTPQDSKHGALTTGPHYHFFNDASTPLVLRLLLIRPVLHLSCICYSLFEGLLCDLLWSDPDKDIQGWGENDRGVSFTFGTDIVGKFLNKHDLDLICRAHQVSGVLQKTLLSPLYI